MPSLTRRRFLGGAAAATVAAATGARAATTSAEGGSKSSADADVLVLGAGLSGLNAALILEEQGLSVRVLDARDRIGGRMYTLSDLPGFPEVGGNTMAAGYGRTIEMAKRCGLELVNWAPRLKLSGGDCLAIDGELYDRKRWAASPRNPLPEAARSLFPAEYVGQLLARSNPLQTADDWVQPGSAKLDRPLYDVLRELGASDEVIRLGFDQNASYGTSSHDLSALMYWFVDKWSRAQAAIAPVAWGVNGGNQKLPIAMASRLKGDVILRREVVGIEDRGERVTVRCRDGSQFRAKQLVCSLPYSTLREMRFDPVLTGPRLRAVMTLPYMKISHVFFVPRRKYWESDGLSASFRTDGPAGAVVAQRFGATDDEITIVGANLRGNTADYVDRFGREGAIRLVQSEIERLRPSTKGALEPVAYHSWGLDPFSAGDWALYAPGQVAAFATTLAQAHGRVHFCGEHTSTGNRGMEAAMESGERVALEVLESA
jgi:monoamine oxidase